MQICLGGTGYIEPTTRSKTRCGWEPPKKCFPNIPSTSASTWYNWWPSPLLAWHVQESARYTRSKWPPLLSMALHARLVYCHCVPIFVMQLGPATSANLFSTKTFFDTPHFPFYLPITATKRPPKWSKVVGLGMGYSLKLALTLLPLIQWTKSSNMMGSTSLLMQIQRTKTPGKPAVLSLQLPLCPVPSHTTFKPCQLPKPLGAK